MREQLKEFYMEWANDYLSIGHFALDKGISEGDAARLIELGRKYHYKDTN